MAATTGLLARLDWMVSDRDFCELDAAAQLELRRVAVRMVLAGKTRIEAAAAVGVDRHAVGAWVTAVERSGEAALAGGKRGRRPGEQQALSAAVQRKLKRLIAKKCPDDLGLPCALWTREAVGLLIERESGVRLSKTTIGSYLRSWNYTAQRPSRRAKERRQPKVRRWLKRTYPRIVERARTEGADIHWGDETGISNQANYGRSYAPQGETPVIVRPAARFTCSMISTLTNLGVLRFMVFEGALTAFIFLSFLQRLIRDAPRKVFLIVDNLRVHRAKLVTAWVKANRDKIELFYLPPYAPEFNPDEFVNNDVKQAVARRQIPHDKASMKAGLRTYMRGLQRRPAKIRRFFQAPTTN
jgi:transposase